MPSTNILTQFKWTSKEHIIACILRSVEENKTKASITFAQHYDYTIISLLKIEFSFHLLKLESPSSKVSLSQSLLKLTLWFWRRRFSNFVVIIFLRFRHLLEKGVALHVDKLEFLSPGEEMGEFSFFKWRTLPFSNWR